MENQTKSFLSAMKEQFQLPGQTLMDFGAELKKLSYEDKLWYHAELSKAGIDCAIPNKA